MHLCRIHSPSLLVVLALALATPRASADQILKIHNDSLTTYKPTAKSSIQDVRALVDQRGTHLDGALSAGSTHGMAMGGNPFGEPWDGNGVLSGTRLDNGTFVINDVDLSFPAEVRWVIGRSYNARQKDSGGSYFASGGYQGANWFQSSQPELLFYNSATDSEDMIYLIYGADRFIEFNRDDAGGTPSTNTFRAVNGAAGAILIETNAGSPDLATYHDQNGNRMVFFWFSDADIDDDIEGSIWRVIDPAGNVAYVGHETNAATALSSYDATTGAITTAYDSAGRRFTYTYTSSKLTQVKAEINSGGWVEVGKVDYSYYVNADSHGEDNDLKLVTITTPLTDSGVSLPRKKHYWYYEGTYNATTNPGYHHQIQYEIDFEGYRKYDWAQDSSLDDDSLSATEANLKPYASANFGYDTERRIVSAWFNGACGCSGAATGTHTFTYGTNGSYSDGAGYDTAWKSRTVVRKPDVTYKTATGAIQSWLTQYFDEAGQPLSRVLSDGDPSGSPNKWATHVKRDDSGTESLVTRISSPASVTAYTHSTGTFTVSTSAGLVNPTTLIASGDTKWFEDQRQHSTGTSGSAYFDSTLTYTERTLTVGDFTITRPLIASRTVYSDEITTGSSGSRVTSFTYTYHSDTAGNVQRLAVKQITTTNPSVATGNNGSGSSTTRKQYLRADGSAAFAEAEDGVFTYTAHTDGQLTKRIDDAQTSNGTDFASGDDPNGNFGITETSTGVRRITTYASDNQARSVTVTQPDGRVLKRYYSKLADGRSVTLAYNDYEATPKFYGPVQYSVTNQAGRAEIQATVALTNNESTSALTAHVDETDSDPITAMDLGSVARMTVSIYDETGGVFEESRPYFDIPTSGAGTDGTNYDATFFGYDGQGRRVRTKAPHGTITRTDHDTLGRTVRQWIGKNDSGFSGGESSGTDNMVKTLENEYDGASASEKGYLTERTHFVEDGTTGQRVNAFTNDVRGRAILRTNPTSTEPRFVFNKFDNMGRLLASGTFTSSASIAVGTDDPTTETGGRLALSQTFFDEMGRVWKTQRHKIDDADGSDDDNVQSLTWHDAAGRTIKVDGEQLAKTFYDRLGRTTHRFVLATINDSVYGDADDVSGDIVLEEHQTVYESTDSDDVLMTAMIARFHDDFSTGETTGALDTNADTDTLKYTATNIEGRIQITANWYDRFSRVTDTVAYGTYGGSDFDRTTDPPLEPARSDTALVTSRSYHTDGSLLEIADPKNLKARFEYDDAGRQTRVIATYVDGTPSTDSDQTIRYTYTDGLRTTYVADLPSGETDQTTTYTYGTTKGTSAGDSKIATGHLLQKVQYPDSSGGTDVVTFAYNAQTQQIWTKDQEGNVIETDFDDMGRALHRRITTLDTDFDGAVRRISTTYDGVGRRQLVTSYDDATVGAPDTVVNEAKFTYDDWGPMAKLEEDRDSAVGASGSVNDYEISYTFEKNTTGRNTIRRRTLATPSGNSITYSYSSTGGLHDGEASRVTQLKDGTVVLANYSYNGVGQVVGTDLQEADVMWNQFGSAGSYPDLDRFNRVTSSRWTKDLSTDRDFVDLDITYDRNSNITVVDDNVNTGMDVGYTIDNLNRLTNAEEGTWSGSAIGTTTREQIWSLSQTGNWTRVKLDLNGDNSFSATDEHDDTRTHNDANELATRDLDSTPGTTGDNYTLTYDAVGNMTDDGKDYEYVYDPFGRLRKVKNTSNQNLVSEYTYNGLGHRIGWHYDVDKDGDVDGSDVWYYFAYDEQWRIAGTFRSSDTSPKEDFIYHAAGADGRSSYIDSVVLRDKDANTSWTSASDGTLEERTYFCQNWRADVVAVVSVSGQRIEEAHYSSYGIPFGFPKGDVNNDGTVATADTDQLQTWINGSTYDARGDMDRDGDLDSTDKSLATSNIGAVIGWGALTDVGNRKGYAGYELDDALAGTQRVYHVRNRVLSADLGRWITRGPFDYEHDLARYDSLGSNPPSYVDPDGRSAAQAAPPSPGGGPPMTPFGPCATNILNQCSSNPYFQAALAYMTAHCAPYAWELVCAGASNPLCEDNLGVTCCQMGGIFLCNQPDYDMTCGTLVHEMMHAADHCRFNQCFESPDGCGGFQACSFERICSEVRAVHFGCCADPYPYSNPDECFDEEFGSFENGEFDGCDDVCSYLDCRPSGPCQPSIPDPIFPDSPEFTPPPSYEVIPVGDTCSP